MTLPESGRSSLLRDESVMDGLGGTGVERGAQAIRMSRSIAAGKQPKRV